MIQNAGRSKTLAKSFQNFVALLCALLIAPGNAVCFGQQAQPAAAPTEEPAAVKLPPDQLDSLVAPIALYPDPMLSQTLVASTYPLEIVQLQQWLEKHKDLKDKALADAVQKENWDPSIQAMAGSTRSGQTIGGQHQMGRRPGERIPGTAG